MATRPFQKDLTAGSTFVPWPKRGYVFVAFWARATWRDVVFPWVFYVFFVGQFDTSHLQGT